MGIRSSGGPARLHAAERRERQRKIACVRSRSAARWRETVFRVTQRRTRSGQLVPQLNSLPCQIVTLRVRKSFDPELVLPIAAIETREAARVSRGRSAAKRRGRTGARPCTPGGRDLLDAEGRGLDHGLAGDRTTDPDNARGNAPPRCLLLRRRSQHLPASISQRGSSETVHGRARHQ